MAGAAFFLAFGDLEQGPTQWCAFQTRAEATRAARNGGELAGESAEMHWEQGSVTRLVAVSESEDAWVSDTYTLDSSGRVTKLARRGNYINDVPFGVEFAPRGDGTLALSAASRKALAGLKIESYWVDWPTFGSLARMPFARLISRRANRISVNFGCFKTGG